MRKQYNAYVVDADTSARMGIKRLLVAAGYNVKEYASVGEFENVLESGISGFVIIDTGMLRMTGLRLYTKMNKLGLSIPIIAVNSDDNETTRKKAKEIKAVGFFRKPVDGTALLDAIKWTLKEDKKGKNHDNVLGG